MKVRYILKHNNKVILDIDAPVDDNIAVPVALQTFWNINTGKAELYELFNGERCNATTLICHKVCG